MITDLPHAVSGNFPYSTFPYCAGGETFVVIEPVDYQSVWYLGWVPEDIPAGMSRIPTSGKARALVGPGPCRWFGVDANGNQILVRGAGLGRIGDNGPHATIPLF